MGSLVAGSFNPAAQSVPMLQARLQDPLAEPERAGEPVLEPDMTRARIGTDAELASAPRNPASGRRVSRSIRLLRDPRKREQVFPHRGLVLFVN